ncbi:MAG: hypothetical protein AB7Q97_10320 [Gammaproteobacteria bacterium]
MSCVCLERLLDLLKPVLPLAAIEIPMPPALPRLAAILPAMENAMSPDSGWSAFTNWDLPPLPISASLIANIGLMGATFKLVQSAFNINLTMPDAALRMSDLIFSLNFNLGQLPKISAGAWGIPLLMATAARVHNNFGINMFDPSQLPKLSANLAMNLAPPAIPLDLRLAQTLGDYGTLSVACSDFGGAFNIVPAMLKMSKLSLPPITVPLDLLALLASLLTVPASCGTFGFDPTLPNFGVSLLAAIQPLMLALPRLNIPIYAGGGQGMMPPSDFALNAPQIPQIDFKPLIGLPIPPLPPLALMATLGGATSNSSCGGGCPVL